MELFWAANESVPLMNSLHRVHVCFSSAAIQGVIQWCSGAALLWRLLLQAVLFIVTV
jgi:hypothetical protein